MDTPGELDGKLKAEIRCRKCNRLLMKGEVRHVEIKCPKCRLIQEIGSPGAERD
ncbi:MAG: Com family DNA-binding transcriptional regulator [Deltaproteobacteria bacterium]|nr:Com family DNA-binding transcriptional regulator [Deltaproteobacteria bacterium]MBZ0220172.1 Com family DNA-binding transcriptional regulator [Deltaproteobacteria bacterium]